MAITASINPSALSGSFAATGISAAAAVLGDFTVSIWGTPLGGSGVGASFAATVVVERSPDGGTTWIGVSTDGTGTPNAYTSTTAVQGTEPSMVLYRFHCTAYTSGTINYSLVGPGVMSY